MGDALGERVAWLACEAAVEFGVVRSAERDDVPLGCSIDWGVVESVGLKIFGGSADETAGVVAMKGQ